MHLIGLTGKAGAGKDKFGEFLLEKLFFEKYSFAGPLKKACCDLFGWDIERVENDREYKEAIDPRWGFSPRRAMQLMGTEYGRNLLRDDIWIHMARLKLEECEFDGLLVPDVRFENEADWIRSEGGLLIHIIRPNACAVAPHASEAGVAFKEGDICVMNDRGLDDLRLAATQIVGK